MKFKFLQNLKNTEEWPTPCDTVRWATIFFNSLAQYAFHNLQYGMNTGIHWGKFLRLVWMIETNYKVVIYYFRCTHMIEKTLQSYSLNRPFSGNFPYFRGYFPYFRSYFPYFPRQVGSNRYQTQAQDKTKYTVILYTCKLKIENQIKIFVRTKCPYFFITIF